MARRLARALTFLLAAVAFAACGDGLSGDLPGEYVLDVARYAEESFERRREAGSPAVDDRPRDVRMAAEAEWRAAARREAEATLLRLVLHDDGRFQVAWRYGEDEGQAAGAWHVEDGAVVLETQSERGRPLASPTRVAALVEPGPRLRLAGTGVPIAATLVRARP